MERTATLNYRFRTRLATLIVAAMLVPMLGALAAPVRATSGPSATLTYSLDTYEETVTLEEGRRELLAFATFPGDVQRLRASLEVTDAATVEISNSFYSYSSESFTLNVPCTDISRLEDTSAGSICPFAPWLGDPKTDFASLDSTVVTVASQVVADLSDLDVGFYETLVRIRQSDGTLIGELVLVSVVFPFVGVEVTVDGGVSVALTGGTVSRTVRRGSSVNVETTAWSDFGTDVVTLSASRPGGALVDDAAAEALCDELFGGACPFDPILGVLGTDGIAPKIRDGSGNIAADAEYGRWTFTLEQWEIFGTDAATECPTPRVDDCDLSFVTVVLDVERPAEATRSGMVLDAGGVPPSVAPGDVRYRMFGDAPVVLSTTRVASPTGVSAVGGDVGIVVVGDRSSSAVGPVAGARGSLNVTLNGPISEGAVVEVWMASEPRLVAAGRSDGSGTLAIVVPVAAPLDGQGAVAPGAHTLQAQVPLASGVAVFDVGVTVGGPVPTSVPSGLAPSSSDVRALPMGMLAFVAIVIALASVGATHHPRRRPATID